MKTQSTLLKLFTAAVLLGATSFPALCQPPVTTGLRLQLEAASGFNPNGGSAATWNDLSGSGNNMTAASNATEPTATTYAGFPALQFNGSAGQYMYNVALNSTFSNTEATLFVVRAASTAANMGISGGTLLSISTDGYFGHEFGLYSDWALHHTSSGNWRRKDHQCYSSLPSDKPVVLADVLGTATTDIEYYVNNVLSTNASVNQGSPVAYPSVNRRIYVGTRIDGGPSAFFTGYIYEVLAYNRKLTAAEVSQVNDYLRCKYEVNYATCNLTPLPVCGEPSSCSDTCYWKVTGNNIINGNNIFGTLTKDDVRIQTSSDDQGIITRDGLLGWNTMGPTAWLHVDCIGHNEGDLSDIRFENLEAYDRGTILIIREDGYVFDSRIPIEQVFKMREALLTEKAQNEAMQNDIRELKARLVELTGRSNGNTAVATDRSMLYQNTPNPFSNETVIDYYVARMNKGAYVMIYDLNGRELKRLPVHASGKGSVKVSGDSMQSGIYIYSLIVDGKEVDSKRMVLVKQ